MKLISHGLFAILFAVLSSHAVRADDRRDLLEITCEPAIGYFSVRPVENWAYDAEPPQGFFPVDLGYSSARDGSAGQKEDGSDEFFACNLGPERVFKVIRKRAFKPCKECMPRLAIFDVTLNDVSIANGYVGFRRDPMPLLPSVRYGAELEICDSLPGEYDRIHRTIDNTIRIECRIGKPEALFPKTDFGPK